MKNKFFNALLLVLFACGIALFVSSCEKDENDPLPYISTSLNR